MIILPLLLSCGGNTLTSSTKARPTQTVATPRVERPTPVARSAPVMEEISDRAPILDDRANKEATSVSVEAKEKAPEPAWYSRWYGQVTNAASNVLDNAVDKTATAATTAANDYVDSFWSSKPEKKSSKPASDAEAGNNMNEFQYEDSKGGKYIDYTEVPDGIPFSQIGGDTWYTYDDNVLFVYDYEAEKWEEAA